MYLRCQKCGRRLTDPESMRKGYGPECWEKLAGKPPGRKEPGHNEDIPGQITMEELMKGENDDHSQTDMPGVQAAVYTATGDFEEGQQD